ncbi:MAG: M3 family metallopeptidase [Acidobacteria bacterium]|nr:M3 family metallopeptidase [Acidobacteriota bacterium]
MAEVNPLLEIRFHVPFDQIRAEHVEPAIHRLLEEAREAQARLAASTGARTFENTLLALEQITEKLDYAMGVVRHLESVATSPELRAAYNAVQGPASEFYSSIPLDSGLWRVLQEYADTAEAKSLTGTRRRLLTKTIDLFRRHGAELDDAGKARLREIDIELTQLTTKFSQNVLDATNAYELVVTDPAKLGGLPPSAVEAARESAKSKGLDAWRFTLQAPSYLALMTYLDDAGLRRQMYHAHATRAAGGEFDNRGIMARILALRREKASLLGFQNFADFVLVDRMAHTGTRAAAFVVDLKQKTEKRFHEENGELAAFRRAIEGPDAPALDPWGVAYYAEKQRAALYDFNEEDLRPYFPLERVLAGMFEIAQRLYGIRVIEEKGASAWDAKVASYSIHDSDGTHLGSFYADSYPRENKRGGAWMDSLITGGPADAGFRPHLGLICGNLTPPVGEKPALLTHREVETVFHEFGHLLHHCLSRVEVRTLAGTNVAWDFVELPSQIMENWCWEREALDLFARHHQSGAPIPDDLYRKMRRAKTFRGANAQMRQLGFAVLDLKLHIEYSPEREGGLIGYARELLQSFSPAPLPPDYAMVAGFTHLFASPVGYGAGYYSYKWAEVLDADAFTRFREIGIFSREVGLEFRDKILARGDSDDPAELYRGFMGRDPNPDALLVRLGLCAADH